MGLGKMFFNGLILEVFFSDIFLHFLKTVSGLANKFANRVVIARRFRVAKQLPEKDADRGERKKRKSFSWAILRVDVP